MTHNQFLGVDLYFLYYFAKITTKGPAENYLPINKQVQGGDGYEGGAGGKQEAHEPLEVPQFFKISDRKTPRSSMPLEQEWLDMTMTEK